MTCCSILAVYVPAAEKHAYEVISHLSLPAALMILMICAAAAAWVFRRRR